MLGVFVEFETNLRRERQLEGIAWAKGEGIYSGRKPSIDAARGRELKACEGARHRPGGVYRVLEPEGAS